MFATRSHSRLLNRPLINLTRLKSPTLNTSTLKRLIRVYIYLCQVLSNQEPLEDMLIMHFGCFSMKMLLRNVFVVYLAIILICALY